jgi:predicted secreted protein
MTAVDEAANDQEYQLAAGQSFILSLASNPSTGYIWEFQSEGDEALLSLLGSSYKSDSSDPYIVGQGGRNYWQFKALQAGTTELTLVYARPWESVQPLKTFTLPITIAESGEQEALASVLSKEVKSESEIISVDLNIPVLQGLQDQSLQTRINERFTQEAMNMKDSLSAEAAEYLADAQEGDYLVWPYELVSRYQLGTLNEELLSLYVDDYQYTGGAHGMTFRRAYNIELTTGEDLALADLFASGYDYQSVINQAISQQIAENPDGYFTGEMGFQGIAADQNYYLQDDCLVVYFSLYEIAPYAFGIPEFKIPLSQLQ